jgi:hypothetical protein
MNLRSATVATLVGLAVAGAATAPAFANPVPAVPTAPASATPTGSRSLALIQAAAAKQTATRIAALDAAIPKITSNVYLTASDRTTILATLNGDLSGLTTLAAKIAADTTAAEAETDYKTIFSTYRVFAVALPQSSYAAAADDLTDSALPKLVDAQKTLSALLAGPDAFKSTPALLADLTDMSAQIATAQQAITGVAAAALAVTPSEYDANHAVLSGSRQSVTTALAAVKLAGTDAKTVSAALQ